MKRETVIVAVVALALLAYLTYPHFRSAFAAAKEKLGGRGRIIDGTAHKGNDSGGVLTSSSEACS